MKALRNYKLWRGLAVVFCLLLAIFIVVSYLGWYYEGFVNDALGISAGTSETTDYVSRYGDLNSDNSKLLQADEDDFNIRAMEEGAVLLKNDDNALPLASAERSVTLFGNSVTSPLYAANGGGSSFKSARGGSLYDAFTSVGFRINDTLYSAYQNSGVSRVSSSTPGRSSIGEVDSSFYTSSLQSSWADDYNDVAIVLFTRYAGEGVDLDTNDADGVPMLSLHQQEKDLLTMIKNSGKFGKTVVLLNTAYAMDLDWLDDDTYGVDACISFGAAGDTGFIGIANLLTGAADFSGHLADTWASDSMSSPAMQNFGDFTYSNHDTNYEDTYVVYAEDIYVGYKYYETRYQDQVFGINNATGNYGVYDSTGSSWNYASEMGRTFGYGLSYSQFTQEVQSITWDQEAHTVTAEVNVTNNGPAEGSNYTGSAKTVVQLYVQCPYESGQAEKPAIQLLGFAKSNALAKGESETVTVTADDYLFATYDENATNGADNTKTGCYVYDAGNYYFAVGDDAHDALNNVIAQRIADEDLPSNVTDASITDEVSGSAVDGDTSKVEAVTLDTLNNTWYATSPATGEVVSNQLQDINYNYFSTGTTITYLTRSDWSTFPQSYTGLSTNSAMNTLLAGKTYVSDGTSASSITTEAKNGISFADMKDVDYDDDDTWNAFLDQLSVTDLATICGETMGNAAITTVNKPANSNTDGPKGLGSTYKFGDGSGITLYVDEVVMSCTFNTNLLAERGAFFAEDALYAGYTMIFGPGADWHRTPYAGRNSEYYSEDANMSYICGAAQVKTMQEGGLIAGIKHFVGNDQETNRHGVSTFSTEQGFRQGSLRCFEGALRDDVGGALGTMTCFNRVGLTAGAACYATQVQILRNEWGFKGVTITDSSKDASEYVLTEECITCGTDMFNNDSSRTNELTKLVKSGNKDGNILAAMRTANKHYYYAFSRSNLVNGLSSDSTVTDFVPWWKTTLIAIDVILGVLAVASVAAFVLGGYVFKKKEG